MSPPSTTSDSPPPVAPPTRPGALEHPVEPDAPMIIPYKNVPALVGYYVAILGALVAILGPAAIGAFAMGMRAESSSVVAGIIGVIGILVGLAGPVAAIVLGMKGLRRFRADPRVRGRTHSWVAILGGGCGVLLALLIGGAMTASLFFR